jgi:uncharacterized phage-associated protein
MAKVDDVAAYILEQTGRIPAMKFQKLVYYSQAWSLVWDERPLFRSSIEAWANGPVCPALYRRHRKQFEVASWPWGHSGSLNESERQTIDSVIAYYGRHSSQWLSELTHREAPWREARAGIPEGEPGTNEITLAALAEYYGSL